MKSLNIVYASLIFIFLSGGALAQEWSYSNEVDEFADTSIHTASVNSLSGKGFVVARCNEKKKLEVYLSVGEFIGSRDSYPVRYRIDKGSPQSSKWGVSTKGTDVFVNNFEKVDLARNLMSGDQLLLEVEDFRGTPHQSKYSLKGSSIALGRVLDACGIAREGVVVEGIDVSVKKHISMWGPKNTKCKKAMLSSLGYSISDANSEKSPELYKALQKYMDDKYAVCGTKKVSRTQEIYECKQKDRFLNGLYADAIKKDGSFKEMCGSLYIDD